MRRRILFGLAIVALLVAMPVVPQGQAANVITLKGILSPGQENPPVVSSAYGNVLVTLNRTTGEITYSGNVFNLGSGVTASHIHVAPVLANGPVVINMAVPVTASNDFGFAGTANLSQFTARGEQGIRSAEDIGQAMAAGTSYFNIHTAVNPGGEIRAQLCPASAAANTWTGIAICAIP